MAREQAGTLASAIEGAGGPSGLADREIIALVAYLERLGTDIRPVRTASRGGP